MSKHPNPELAAKILDLAREELKTKSPAEINMRRLAELAGVSPTAIYYYYPSKGELFSILKFEAVDEVVRRIEEEAEREENAIEKLRALMRVFIEWCAESPRTASLLMEGEPEPEDLEPERMRRYYAISDLACGYLREARAAGLAHSDEPELDVSVAQACLWGIFTQFAGRRAYPRYWDDIHPLADRFAEIFLGAIGAGGKKECQS